MKNDIEFIELKKIGLTIRKIREAQSLSRQQLAFEIGTTERQIFRIEAGEINSGIMSFIKISRSLNVPLYKLFEEVK